VFYNLEHLDKGVQIMEDPKERLTKCVSTAELQRRWKAVREMMRERKIDYLVMQNSEEFLGGVIRWFTDFSARHQFPMTVIFPVDDEMTTINCGGDPPADQFPPAWAVRGIKNRLGAPYFSTIQYTNTLDAELTVNVLREKKKPTIGLVERAFIPVTFYEYLLKNLPDAKFQDATEWIDEIKVIKSPEEIELIKGTAALQDKAIEHLKKTIRPGMRDFEVLAEAQYSTVRSGSERQLIQVGSGPAGTPAGFFLRHLQNRMIKEGDQVSILIETNGPGGYYTEIMKCFMVGVKPSQELQDAHGVAMEAQKLNVDRLKPGADPKELWDMTNDFLKSRGYAPNLRLYAHGQGLGLVERPLIRYNETWKIKAGMNITIHPRAVTKTAWASVCENWMVGLDGAGSCLHKSPQEIVVID
jgi:Xaa-Pro aminopeptidase